jgi:hypothetical protein
MRLIEVESTMIRAVGYDTAAGEMEVVFESGRVWRYRDVPPEVYEQLLASGSKGGYMRDFIIDCYLDYEVTRRHR